MSIKKKQPLGFLLSLALATGLLTSSTVSAAGLEEVVVTAQKVSQNVQDVPIAVTAFNAASLEAKGIDDVSKMSDYAPNVTLDASTPFSGSDQVLAAFIRGIGQNDFAFNQDPGVGVYIDGVFLARSVGSNTNMLDVERVEILKGPQGTLFGRNTIGGAISIVTREPGDEFMAKAEVTGGSYDRIEFQGTMDLPITEDLLSSVSFSYKTRDGYQKRIPFPQPVAGSSGIADCDNNLPAGDPCPYVVDDYTTQPAAGYDTSSREGGIDRYVVRGKLVYLPTNDLKVTLTADYSDGDQSATPTTQLNITPSGIPVLPGNLGFGGVYNACIAGPPYPAGGLYATLCNSPRLGNSPVPTVAAALSPLGNVNNDGDMTNNRLPWDSRFITNDIDKTYATGNSFSKMENWGVAGTIDYDINDGMHLKSITAYRRLYWRAGMDLDGSPLSILHTSFTMAQHQISQELQFTGTVFDNRVDYAFGGYFFHEKGHLHDFVTFPAALLMIDGPNNLETTSEAMYGHLNIRMTDEITLVAGGRFTIEHKEFEGFQSDDNGFSYKLTSCFPPGSPNTLGAPASLTCQQALGFPSASEPYRYYPPGRRTLNFSNFSPTVGIQYYPAQDLMFYATLAKGYKTGSWTTRLSNPQPTYDDSLHFDPEKATTTEVGMKSEWFDRRLRLNVALFHTKYSGIQLNSQQGISPTLLNAGDAVMDGFEIESLAQITDGLSIAANVGYIDAKYTRLNNVADNGIPITPAFDLPKTPEWKFYIGPTYIMPLADLGGELQFNVDYTYISSVYNDLGNTELLKRPSVDKVNASVTYRFPGDKYEITVGGTNLTDERNIITGQWQGGDSNIYGTYNPPRMWYATLRASY